LVETASCIEAEIEHMRFVYLHVPGMYSLEKLELPAFVDDEDMTCTFNTETKRFTMKLPVVTEDDSEETDDAEDAAAVATEAARKAAAAATAPSAM